MGDETCDNSGLTNDERARLSLESYVCGIQNCEIPPEQLCRQCGFWYCVRHDKLHYQRFPDHLKRGTV